MQCICLQLQRLIMWLPWEAGLHNESCQPPFFGDRLLLLFNESWRENFSRLQIMNTKNLHMISAQRAFRTRASCCLPVTQLWSGSAWWVDYLGSQEWGKEEGKQKERGMHLGQTLPPLPPHLRHLRRQSSQTLGSRPGRNRLGGACHSSPRWGSPKARKVGTDSLVMGHRA